MKKNRIIAMMIGISAIVIAVFWGCTKTDANSDKDIQTSTNKSVGQSHNSGLDYIYKSIQIKSYKSTDLLLDDLRRCANSFLMEEFENDINAQFVSIQNNESAILKIRSDYQEFGCVNIENVWFANNSNDLSEKQKELLSILADALNSNDLQTVLIACQTVNSRVINECSEEERTLMEYSIDICIASSQYWSENIDKWIQLFGVQETRWFNWGSLPKSDIAGGIGGAIGGAIVGGGAGAIPGALGGAIGTSATDAVLQILNHYF